MTFAGNPSLKNQPLSSASQALGLGDQLQTQVMDQVDELKKKKLAGQLPNSIGALNPNSAGLSPSVMSLLGSNTGGM